MCPSISNLFVVVVVEYVSGSYLSRRKEKYMFSTITWSQASYVAVDPLKKVKDDVSSKKVKDDVSSKKVKYDVLSLRDSLQWMAPRGYINMLMEEDKAVKSY